MKNARTLHTGHKSMHKIETYRNLHGTWPINIERERERKKPDDSLYGKWKRITHGMALGRKNKKARIPPSNLSVIEVFSPLPYGSIRLWAGNFIKKGQKTGNGSQSARKFETRSVHRFPV